MFKLGQVSIALLLAALVGCAGQPFDYHATDEIKQGPSVFSKEEDGFTLYSTERGNKPGGTDTSDRNKEEAGIDTREFSEFQEYQEYKEWKRRRGNSVEHKDFKEWQEWKAYQKWKQQQ